MFQDYALFPNITAEKKICFTQKEKNKEEVTKLMRLLNLETLKDQHPIKLSGGQKQRVPLAHPLAAKPNLLLQDEHLSTLNWEMRTSLQQEILKAHEFLNSATLLVSHDISEVFKLASSVLVLKNGIIVKSGKPEEVFKLKEQECINIF